MNRYVIKSHRPGQWAIAIIGLSAIIATISWFFLDKSHWSVINRTINENEQLNRLIGENRNLVLENQDLREQNLMAEKLAGMDKQTASLLQDEIESLQEDIFRMKQELEFYHGVMAGTATSIGLTIQGLNIYPLSQPNTYLLNIVLIHVTKSVMVAEGDLSLRINGTQDDRPVSYTLPQLLDVEEVDLTYNFRNFKKYELEISLPEGFSPADLGINLQPKNNQDAAINKMFDWAVEN